MGANIIIWHEFMMIKNGGEKSLRFFFDIFLIVLIRVGTSFATFI